MSHQNVTFQNAQGHTLSARLDLPADGQPIACALFAHCFTCGKDLTAIRHIATALTNAGFALLRFDFTGLGESEGDFADTNFTSTVSDLLDAAHFMEKKFEAPSLLIGHSLGGAAVLQAAADLPAVKAVATIGAPFDPAHVRRLIQPAEGQLHAEGQAVVHLGGRPFTVRKQFLDDLERTAPEEAIGQLGRPLLIFHSPVDRIVSVDNAASIFHAARHPKSFISLDTADHLLSDPSDACYVGATLAAWAEKYLRVSQREAKQPVGHDNRLVARIGETGFRTEVIANGHSLIADEPLSFGGTNLGPTPYDLLVAGLGACTVMTLRMYADRKGWPLEGVTARLNHQKLHAEDSEHTEQKGAKVDHIDRSLTLDGPLDEAQRQRLLAVADRCPVHRTLEGDIIIRTELDAPDARD